MRQCVRCEKEFTRVALDGGQWVCGRSGCVFDLPCKRCDEPAIAIGVERYAIGNMDRDDYRLEQCIAYRCVNNHLQWGPVHLGPGAEAARG